MKFFLLMLLSMTELTAQVVKWDGFLDTYYAYDVNRPKKFEREYTTQPVRTDEFNINLAYIGARLEKEKIRGRIALQWGNSVTKNTVFEPKNGATSGQNEGKIFQEAYAGYKLNEKTWIDAGIYLGHIGMESWISRDNLTYSRSMNLDYVPYYSAGVRLEHVYNTRQKFQVHLMNGWQNISENNRAKAIGLQYEHRINQDSIFTYNNFLGDEQVVSDRPRMRGYHNFILKNKLNQNWDWHGSFDIAHQAHQSKPGVVGWYALSQVISYSLEKTKRYSARFEYYSDPHQANIVTKTKNGFQVASVSINRDQYLDENLLWRCEIRGFRSKDRIYPLSNSLSQTDLYLATSFSLNL